MNQGMLDELQERLEAAHEVGLKLKDDPDVPDQALYDLMTGLDYLQSAIQTIAATADLVPPAYHDFTDVMPEDLQVPPQAREDQSRWAEEAGANPGPPPVPRERRRSMGVDNGGELCGR